MAGFGDRSRWWWFDRLFGLVLLVFGIVLVATRGIEGAWLLIAVCCGLELLVRLVEHRKGSAR